MADPRSTTGTATAIDGRDGFPATVPGLLLDRVSRSPDSVAYLRPDGERWRPSTWTDVRREVFDLAAGLIGRGVEAGSRVAICATTCYRTVVADLANSRARAGATVPIYPATRAVCVADPA
ncbi:hypothetical protein NJ76_32105 [Rhodococcus sp. IITR03]|nr:hypothetical protein NJ76_32105 [Rhodococcus sp. IITR03]